MKQHLVFLLFSLSFYSLNVRAQSTDQSILNSTGGSANYLSITYEWSVGELALIESFINQEYALNNGLLQMQKIGKVINYSELIIIPNNILSPNGDGENDTWEIKNLNLFPENEVKIFDRTGKQIFYGKNYQNNWDGRISGQVIPEDAYYYIILIQNGEKTEIKKGFITIIN